MPTKVLMVCLGNICRSPLAEGVFRHLSKGQDFEVDSAGTANYHTGAAPDSRSIAIAAKNGIDISNQKARQLTANDIATFDHILVMDEQNLQNAYALCTSAEQRAKIALLTSASGHEATHVPDPYYGDEKGFDFVFNLVHDCCKNWLKKHT
ncbi:MAG: low molecular weight phosphotyrosine protein phosphatase [Bacteroidetes bacterium]|nr:low molecular weight phosphotyrosine protein phosphatase [Bacteroidota bacterium]